MYNSTPEADASDRTNNDDHLLEVYKSEEESGTIMGEIVEEVSSSRDS